jgi:hypothetical protein
MGAARSGQGFDSGTGLPESLTRRDRDVSRLEHAREFVGATWSAAAAKGPVSILETLSAALLALTRDLAGAPEPDVLPTRRLTRRS